MANTYFTKFIFANQADPNNVNNSIIFFYPMFGSQPEVIPGKPLTILASDSYSLLSTTVNLQGYSEIFLIHNPDHSLNYVVQGPNNSYSLFNLSATLNNIQFTSINPSTNTAGELEVFALGNDSNLYHAYLNSSNGQWTPLTPIISGISHLSVSQNSDGYSEVFAISNVNLLYNIHQDTNPDTGLGWQIELIEFPSNGSQPALISTYSSLVSFSDEVTTKPLAQEPLMVYASDLLEVQINGKYTSIDPDNGAGCETDSTSKVTINYTADGLNTPTLKITAGFLDPEEALFIDPSANAKATVDSMTVADLQTASTPNLPGITSAPLLAPNYQTPSGAAGVQSSFQQLLNFQSSQLQTLGQTTKFINRGKARHGVFYGKADLKTIKRIDPNSVKDQHWHISFSPVFTFEKLDQETVIQKIKDVKLGFIQSLFDSWDDLWTGIENSAISFLDWVCDGVSSTITYMVDGISYYYDQVIETVDQAINALEGLFELFGATIIEWLTYLGNLLSWDDILNTSQNIQPYFLQPLTTVQGLLAKGNIYVNGWFAGQRQNVTSFFNNINTYFPATDTVQNAQSYNNETIPGSEAYKSRRTLGYRFAEDNTVTVAECFDPSVAGNWLLDKLWENINGGSGNDSFSIPSDLLASVNDLFTAIENSQASQDVQDLVAQVQTLLTSLTSNESNWEQTTVAVLLNIFQDLILLLLDAADAIATLLLQLAGSLITVLESFFTAAIDIPIVSWFYGYITNSQTLTWIGLCSLLIAVPMTIGYKLANNNNPPFPLQLSKDSAERGTNPIPEAIIAWISTTSLLAYTAFDFWAEFEAIDDWAANNAGIELNYQSSKKGWLLVATTTLFSWLPLGVDWPDDDDNSGYTISAWVLWSTWVLPGLINPFYYGIAKEDMRDTKSGVSILVFLGFASLASGISTSVLATDENVNWFQYFRNTVSSVPLLAKLILPFINVSPEGGIAAVSLLLIDELGNLTAAVLPIAEYYAQKKLEDNVS